MGRLGNQRKPARPTRQGQRARACCEDRGTCPAATQPLSSSSSFLFLSPKPCTLRHFVKKKNPIEMQPPQTPITPWGSKPRRDMPPSLLSPSFSWKPFQATGGDQDADAASEHPCVRTPLARAMLLVRA
jgi:hypothetical protein